MTARATPAIGVHDRRVGRPKPQVVIRLDQDTFDEIRARAISERTSFAEQVRLLIEWGMESAR